MGVPDRGSPVSTRRSPPSYPNKLESILLELVVTGECSLPPSFNASGSAVASASNTLCALSPLDPTFLDEKEIISQKMECIQEDLPPMIPSPIVWENETEELTTLLMSTLKLLTEATNKSHSCTSVTPTHLNILSSPSTGHFSSDELNGNKWGTTISSSSSSDGINTCLKLDKEFQLSGPFNSDMSFLASEELSNDFKLFCPQSTEIKDLNQVPIQMELTDSLTTFSSSSSAYTNPFSLTSPPVLIQPKKQQQQHQPELFLKSLSSSSLLDLDMTSLNTFNTLSGVQGEQGQCHLRKEEYTDQFITERLFLNTLLFNTNAGNSTTLGCQMNTIESPPPPPPLPYPINPYPLEQQYPQQLNNHSFTDPLALTMLGKTGTSSLLNGTTGTTPPPPAYPKRITGSKQYISTHDSVVVSQPRIQLKLNRNGQLGEGPTFWGMWEDERNRMVYVSWLPRAARASDRGEKKRCELVLKDFISKILGFNGLHKVLLFPPSSAHCKLLFSSESAARQFLGAFGGVDGHQGPLLWKGLVCQHFNVNIRDGIHATRVRVIWADQTKNDTEIFTTPNNILPEQFTFFQHTSV